MTYSRFPFTRRGVKENGFSKNPVWKYSREKAKHPLSLVFSPE
jgi:hypothetical protein